jgi:hypothetical protein
MPKSPKRVTAFRRAALALYKKLFGCRCIKCAAIVDISRDGILHDLDGELMLTHRLCGA